MYKYKNTEKKLCKLTDALLNKCKNNMIVSVRPSSGNLVTAYTCGALSNAI